MLFVKHLTSRDNPRLKQLRRWASHGRSRREAGVILLDGLHLIHALLDAGGVIEQLIVSESGLASRDFWLAAWPAASRKGNRGDDSVLLPDTLFGGSLRPKPRPAFLPLPGDRRWAAPLMPAATRWCLMVCRIRETSARCCALPPPPGASGLAGRWLCRPMGPQGPARRARGTVRTGDPRALRPAGLARRLSRHQHRDPARCRKPLYETDLAGPLAWVFGAEGQGVSALVAEAATLGVVIPMPGRVESLNVAAAAAICLFEMIRRRR